MLPFALVVLAAAAPPPPAGELEPVIADYSKKDTILYALGLGVGAADPFDPAELKYVYESKLVALLMMDVKMGEGAMRLDDKKLGVK